MWTMNLLTKNIQDISFDDVVAFCKQGVLEWTQLDYKLKMPKDLAKHFATFSNTQGGLIVIGVGEDTKGLPTTHAGIPNDSKLVDQVHQFAANVTPLPTYEVRATDEKNGNVFVLIRISEGAAAPYTTLNDPTIWIRNGNISTPASREELLCLSNKRADADTLRNNLLESASQYFQNRLIAAEEERVRLIDAQKPDVYKASLTGDNSAILAIALMPYYPSGNLVHPQDLVHKEYDYIGEEYHRSLFNQGGTVTMPGGLSAFSWNERTGVFRNDQLHTNGLSYSSSDILQSDQDKKQITVPEIAHKLRSQLRLIQHFYRKTGYSGLVEGIIALNGGSGAKVVPIGSDRHILYMPESGSVYMPKHLWRLHFDTNQLSDQDGLGVIFTQAVRDVSWGLGAGDIPETVMERFLEVNGWKKPAVT